MKKKIKFTPVLFHRWWWWRWWRWRQKKNEDIL